MKVLVATGRTQGVRKNDYHWAIEGELVRIGEVCRKDRDDPDGGCGCGRGFGGLASHRATTTARVAELALTQAQYTETYRASLQDQGWYHCEDCIADEIEFLARVAADCSIGAVIERRLDVLQERPLPSELPG
jgi:hypothetical protein